MRRGCPICDASSAENCTCTRCLECGDMNDDSSVEVVDLSTPDGEIVWVHEDCAKHDPTRFSTDLDTEMEDRK